MNPPADTTAPKVDWWWAAGLAVAAALMRLVPYFPFFAQLSPEAQYLWNFTPVGALALFLGARLRSTWAFALPLASMAVSDVLLWWLWDLPPFNWSVYVSFLLYALGGCLLLRTASPWRVAAVSLLGSAQFFLLTNFGVWFRRSVDPGQLRAGDAVRIETVPGLHALDFTLDGSAVLREPEPNTPYFKFTYARNLSGLGACYAVALPFLRNTAAGDLVYSGLFFGVHAAVVAALAQRRKVSQPV
jgi:hypothetical protein